MYEDAINGHGQLLRSGLFPTRWLGAFALVLAITAMGCAPDKGQTMSSITEAEFPDPTLRRAAQLVEEGSVKEAIRLAEKVPDGINAIGPENDTLLIVAIKTGNSASIEALLAAGANPNIPEKRSPIAVAASTAKIDAVQALLSRGANPNGTSNQQSALWRAANNNRKDVVDLLLTHHASIDQVDGDEFTPALAAAQVDRYRMVEYLLDRGANPFVASSHGLTIGYWISKSNIPANSDEGRARSAVLAKLREGGFPWPPPSLAEVVSAKAAHRWPPQR